MRPLNEDVVRMAILQRIKPELDLASEILELTRVGWLTLTGSLAFS